MQLTGAVYLGADKSNVGQGISQLTIDGPSSSFLASDDFLAGAAFITVSNGGLLSCRTNATFTKTSTVQLAAGGSIRTYGSLGFMWLIFLLLAQQTQGATERELPSPLEARCR